MFSRRSFLSRMTVFLGGASAVPMLVEDAGSEPPTLPSGAELEPGVYSLVWSDGRYVPPMYLLVRPVGTTPHPFLCCQPISRDEVESFQRQGIVKPCRPSRRGA